MHYLALATVRTEEAGRLHLHPHDPEDGDKVLLMGVLGVLEPDKGGLTGGLGDNLVVGARG